MPKMPSPEINDLGQAYRSGNLVPYPRARISTGPGISSSLPDEKGPAYRSQVAGIIEQVRKLGRDQQRHVLQDLGITPVWYERREDIPGIINKIMN